MSVNKNLTRISAMLIVLTLSGAACSNTDPEAGPTESEPDNTIANRDAGANQDAEDGYMQTIEARRDLVQPTAVELLAVDEGDSELLLTFEMGSQKCFGIDASVEEAETEVVVAISSGSIPGEVEPCIDGVYPYQVSVPLSGGLDGRTVRQAELLEPIAEPVVFDTATGRPDATGLVGMSIEEAVQWAIDNDVEWRLESYDGLPRGEGPSDENRLSFEAVNDKVAAVRWR